MTNAGLAATSQPGDHALGLRPLTARSVILSVLLGSHPPMLAVRSLVRTAQLFGITEGTTRVALSRLLAEGDVVSENGRYRLSERLLRRQRHQDEGRQPPLRPWRGHWELAVADPTYTIAAGRTTLEAELVALRLAELRPGTWLRPANLRRAWPDSLGGRVWRYEARLADSRRPAGELAARLWDLEGWAARAEALLAVLALNDQPSHRFVVMAAIVRHLEVDPLLPASLLPPRWPGARLRAAYTAYEGELGDLIRHQRAGSRGATQAN